MFIVVTVIHIVACLFLIGVVLLQQGKGADMGAVFGGSSSTIFGSGGAGNFLTRLTTIMAVVFMLTSLTLTYTGARRMGSTVFDSAPLPEAPPLEVPAQPQGKAVGVEPQAQAPAPAPAGEQAAPAPAAEPQAAAPQAAAPAQAPGADEPAAEPAND
jgi:preprotein translocase subunit SecG